MSWNLNFGGKSAEQIDKESSRPPDGFYLAECIKRETSPEDFSEEFTWKITKGTSAGAIVRGRLNNPAVADTPEKAESMVKKAKIWAVRLGVVPRDAVLENVTVDWTKAVGWKGVLKIKTRHYEKRDGTKGEITEPDYAGIYPLDHADLDGPTRHALGIDLLPGQSAEPKARGKNGSTTVPTTTPAKSTDALAEALLG